jgi:glycosyltransferase involved in cell wall biosynthesis
MAGAARPGYFRSRRPGQRLSRNLVVKVSGFTIVRNAVRLDFPLVESIRSILPICQEVVVNVGESEDDTLALVQSIGDPKIRVLETRWDSSKRDLAFGEETLRAMRACRHPWGVYIQADEVLHEDGAIELRRAIEENDGDPRVEGLLVRYLHFYGGLDTIATHRRWYRREIRAVRLDPQVDVRPYQGAQGFRVGPQFRKIRARLTGAQMFHYGWGRPAKALQAKRLVTRGFFPHKEPDTAPLLPWMPGIQPFNGQHPAVAREWVEARRHDPERRIAPRFFHPQHVRLYISDAIERLTGHRVFEFRNYTLV